MEEEEQEDEDTKNIPEEENIKNAQNGAINVGDEEEHEKDRNLIKII